MASLSHAFPLDRHPSPLIRVASPVWRTGELAFGRGAPARRQRVRAEYNSKAFHDGCKTLRPGGLENNRGAEGWPILVVRPTRLFPMPRIVWRSTPKLWATRVLTDSTATKLGDERRAAEAAPASATDTPESYTLDVRLLIRRDRIPRPLNQHVTAVAGPRTGSWSLPVSALVPRLPGRIE